METIVAGNYLRDGAARVGEINPQRFADMAQFLYDSGVLKDASGAPLAWPGDVSHWYEQSWLTR